MSWTVKIQGKAIKNIEALPDNVKRLLFTLIQDLKNKGPIRGDWPNYGKIGKRHHHCHLKKGHPTYVAVWVDFPGAEPLIEVIYAGVHERAPY